MDKAAPAEATTVEAAALQAEIDRMLAEMEQAEERINRYQDETGKLKAETRALLARIIREVPGTTTERPREGAT